MEAYPNSLLILQVVSPQLHIKSRKAPSPEGFISHTSKLEQLDNSPFFVHWNQGKIHSIYIPLNEALSMTNLKKGIASLFQFQLLNQVTNETDSSGNCVVNYETTGPTTLKKTKKSCTSEELYLVHPDSLFSVDVQSVREGEYEIASDNSCIQSLTNKESHEMTVNIRQEAGYKVNTIQEMKLKQSSSVTPIVGEKLDDVIQQISDELNLKFTHENLMTEKEVKMCQDSECPSFSKLVKENMVNLGSDNFGKIKGATGYLKVLDGAREASKEEIHKVLKTVKKQNKDVL